MRVVPTNPRRSVDAIGRGVLVTAIKGAKEIATVAPVDGEKSRPFHDQTHCHLCAPERGEMTGCKPGIGLDDV